MGEPFRIITFDGGGVCGLYSITLIQRLLEQHPDLIAKTDLLAGTSTGGLIALCLASGMHPRYVQKLYVERTPDIFRKSWASFFGLCGAKYKNDGLIKACYDTFGRSCLGDLPMKVVIPAFDLKSEASPDNPSWRTKFFHNFDDYPVNAYKAEPVADVAIRTCSAPTYFPTYQGYCDGGVACNDPAMVAVAMAMAKANRSLEDIRVLSVGTGGQVRFVDGQDLGWGGARWLKPILSIFMDGQVLVTDYQCKKMLGDRYFRLSPITPDIQMDDLSKRQALIDLADQTDLRECSGFVCGQYLRCTPDQPERRPA